MSWNVNDSSSPPHVPSKKEVFLVRMGVLVRVYENINQGYCAFKDEEIELLLLKKMEELISQIKNEYK